MWWWETRSSATLMKISKGHIFPIWRKTKDPETQVIPWESSSAQPWRKGSSRSPQAALKAAEVCDHTACWNWHLHKTGNLWAHPQLSPSSQLAPSSRGICTKVFQVFWVCLEIVAVSNHLLPGDPLQAQWLRSLALPSSLSGKIFHGKFAFRLLKSVTDSPASVEAEAQVCCGFGKSGLWLSTILTETSAAEHPPAPEHPPNTSETCFRIDQCVKGLETLLSSPEPPSALRKCPQHPTLTQPTPPTHNCSVLSSFHFQPAG